MSEMDALWSILTDSLVNQSEISDAENIFVKAVLNKDITETQ